MDFDRIIEVMIGVIIVFFLIKIFVPSLLLPPQFQEEITTFDVTNYINKMDSVNKEQQSRIDGLEKELNDWKKYTPDEIKKLRNRPSQFFVTGLLFVIVSLLLFMIGLHYQYVKHKNKIKKIIIIIDDKHNNKIKRIKRML